MNCGTTGNRADAATARTSSEISLKPDSKHGHAVTNTSLTTSCAGQGNFYHTDTDMQAQQH